MQEYWLEPNGREQFDTTVNHFHVFNRQGYLIEAISYRGQGVVASKGTYDSSKKIFEEHSYNSSGKSVSTVEYAYDEQGNKISMKSYNFSNTPDYMERYIYDNKNNLIERDYYKDGKHLSEKETYKFNDASQQMESRYYNDAGEPADYTTYKYDSKGNKIEDDDFTDGKLHHINKYQYDDMSNVIETKSEYPDRNINLINTGSYEYDNHGNWTKKKGRRNDQSGFLSVRVFTYY